MSDTENQMALFEGFEPPPVEPAAFAPAPVAKAVPAPETKSAPPPKEAAVKAVNRVPPASNKEHAAARTKIRKSQATPGAKGVSGLVPVGDVRLTANIREDLHLKLKIASAHRRTTIGEIIEELIERYV